MAGVNRGIPIANVLSPGSLAGYTFGDILYDNAGRVGVVALNGSSNVLVTLPADFGSVTAAFTGTGSGAANIAGNVAGFGAVNCLVLVYLRATGNIAIGAPAGTTTIRNVQGSGTPNVTVLLLSESDGDFGIAFTGTGGQSVSATVVSIVPTGSGPVLADGAFPA